MKVILTMAISANGIIASETSGEDFLSHTNTNWLQFVKLAKRIGCFIWGRKTYETVLSWSGDCLSDIRDVKKIVISRSNIKLQQGFELAGSPEEALTHLENYGFTEAIVTGGAITNSEFAKRGLIDEVVLDLNPSFIGDGVPLFQPDNFELKLELNDVQKLSDGIVELRYRVKK